MSPSRTISLAEAVSWFAWDQRFTAEDFLAAERLKMRAGEFCRHRQNLKKGKKPILSKDDLKIYLHAVADDWKIAKRIRETSGHSYASKAGRKAAKKELDVAFAVIVKAIQDRRVTSARGQLDRGAEGGRPILWKWFKAKPEPTADCEMNAIQKEGRTSPCLIDDDEKKWPNPTRWIEVEFDWDEIEKLRGGTSAWPLNKRRELAVTDEPKPGAPESPEEEPAKQSNRGRKPIWDWDGAAAHLLLVANSPDGLPDLQADIERLVAGWFRQTVDDEPVESAIRKHVSSWCKEVLGEASNSPTSN